MVDSRRIFISKILNGLGLAAIAPILYGVSNFIYPPLSGSKRKAAKTIIENPESLFVHQDYSIIKVGDTDAIIFKKSDNTYEAMSLQCTHAGCSLQWKNPEQKFFCACHGGSFHRDGSVAHPPPIRPLEFLTVRTQNGKVIIIDKPV